MSTQLSTDHPRIQPGSCRIDLNNPFLRLLNAWLANMNIYSIVIKLPVGDASLVHFYPANCYQPGHPNF